MPDAPVVHVEPADPARRIAVRVRAQATPRHGRDRSWNIGQAWLDQEGGLQLRVDRHGTADPTALAVAIVAALADAEPRPIDRWFVRGATTDLERAVAGELGLEQTRELWQMRVPLPHPDPPPGLRLRPFVPGQDEEAWLRVNRRSFASHREQGRQSLDGLLALEREPWFDEEGFLLHAEDGVVDGFCWTKVHGDAQPPVGEIFVIGVDPDAGGRGLGRALVLAGLAHLHARGLTEGMLYVDEDNGPAVRLYRDLGFVTVARDKLFERTAGDDEADGDDKGDDDGQPVETPTSDPTR